ncbi:MAG: GYDIA family GHMP kinase [Bacteroidota bacterium]
MEQYFAHGKLLLTGEYFVLDGAKALAVPTRLGQRMTVQPDAVAQNELRWTSLDKEGTAWFSAVFHKDQLDQLQRPEEQRLVQLFNSIAKQSSTAYKQLWGNHLTLHLEFPRQWGLGSSSTMISLLSQWLNVNPYQLLEDSFGGSGYDLACATASGPIQYQRRIEKEPLVSALDWQPSYSDQLFFAYQGHKQNSREGIQYYRELCGAQVTLIDEVSALTEAFLSAHSLSAAAEVATEHENFISTVLQMSKVKDQRFANFPGAVKSLGAWGGDFVLAFSPWNPDQTRRYFNEKGCPDVLSYDEMLLGVRGER